jgi:hypothetical protein
MEKLSIPTASVPDGFMNAVINLFFFFFRESEKRILMITMMAVIITVPVMILFI